MAPLAENPSRKLADEIRRSRSPLTHPLANLFEVLPDTYFFVKDRKSRFVDGNRGFVEMLGAHHLSEIVGKSDFDFSPRQLAEKFIEDDKTVMTSRTAIANRVEMVPNADGSISWHLTSKVPLYNSAGRVCGLAGITQDLKRSASAMKRYGAMSEVLDYIDINFGGPIRVADLAALVYLSISQFERRFKALFQTTPLQYINRVRINKACLKLVSTEDTITEIASHCGFYDHSHFIRQFSRSLGVTPHDYRLQHR
jgi:PAS domain S-box-containing protein